MNYKFCPCCGKELVLKEIGDEGNIPFCDACSIPYFNHPVCCVLVAVINDYDEVLLLKQDYVSKTNWVLVAGYLQVGENLEQAVIREVKEETGIEVSNITYIDSYYYDKKEMIMIGYVVKAKDKHFILNSKEVDDIKWEPIYEAVFTLRSGSIGQTHLKHVLNHMNKSSFE